MSNIFHKARAHVKVLIKDAQVRADAYEKIDKELLGFVEDVLLNACENATERMLEYAALLEPKCKPTDVRKKGQVSMHMNSETHCSSGERTFRLNEVLFHVRS